MDTFEIVLRVSGGSDYCTFYVEDTVTDLYELECLICDALDSKFVLEEAPL